MRVRQQKEKLLLSAKGLMTLVRESISSIKEPSKKAQGLPSKIAIQDCLMSALAVFGLKYPSLLQFDLHKSDSKVRHNLNSLYGIEQVPSDTYMRSRIDEVDPQELRRSYKGIFSAIQRGKVLENYTFIDGHYLLAIDGTEFFCSHEVHCENCCARNHRDGSKTYYHQMLAGVIVHPDHREVFPLYPEAILKRDGQKKNDCEKNAASRFLEDFRREHPHLPVIVVQDALSANGPHIRRLQDLKMSFIIGIKPAGNKTLFSRVEGIQQNTFKMQTGGSTYRFRFVNGVPLNDSNQELKVNFFECWETTAKGEIRHFSWITNIEITKKNIYKLSCGGRARWHIENETFNTLKNQGYHFEHNFGHGYKNLSNVFALLMMLAFLIDQVQQRCCGLFQDAWKKQVTKSNLWDLMRSLFRTCFISNWADFFAAIAYGYKASILHPNTS